MKYFKAALLVLAAISVFALFYSLPRFIRIKRISCKSQYGECSSVLKEKLTKSEGLGYSKAKSTVAASLAEDNTISEFLIQYKIPDKLSVNVLEKKPKYALKNSDVYALVDKNGIVINILKETPLPFMETANTPANVGDKVNPEELFALEILYAVNFLYQTPKGVIEAKSLNVELPEGIKVIFPTSGDRQALLGALRLILDRLNAEPKDSRIDKEIAVIDLRFQNPVLK